MQEFNEVSGLRLQRIINDGAHAIATQIAQAFPGTRASLFLCVSVTGKAQTMVQLGGQMPPWHAASLTMQAVAQHCDAMQQQQPPQPDSNGRR